MVSKRPDSLGRRLRRLRQQRSLTSLEVADAVGTTQSHLCAVERGRTASPRYALLSALADFYELSISELVGDEKNRSRSMEAEQISDWYEHDLPEEAQRAVYAMVENLTRQYKDAS